MRIALTDRFVASAKAETRAEFFDSRVKGLSLRVSPTARSWAFHYTLHGKRARHGLGPYPAVSLAAARGLALEARAAVEAGTDPRASKSDAMTVAMLVESYLAKHVLVNLRSSSAKQIERRLRKNVLPAIGNVQLAVLHRRDINRVLDAVVARAPIEGNRVFADMRAAMRWAVGRGDLDRDPVAGMSAPSPQYSRDRVLSDAEIKQLWNVLPTALPNQIDCQRVLKLCLATGQRVGEVTGMRRDELDLAARVWRLPASRVKNNHAHQVPLSVLAIGIVEQALADAGDREHLFALPPVAVSRFAVRAKFGIAHWTPHDLRRTVLTQMAALGVEPIVLGHVANHRGTTRAGVTLGVYVRYSFERETRRALDLWGDRLGAIVSGTGADVTPLVRRKAAR